jgi:hypothetical protein
LNTFPFSSPERVWVNPYDGRDVWVTTFGGGIWEGGVGPDGVGGTTLNATQIQVHWSDNSANEAGFEIERATDAGFTQNVTVTTASANATSATISGLAPRTTYYFRVRAANGEAKSAYSAVASTTTAGYPMVSSVIINQGAIQRSRVTRLDVVFNEPVMLADGAISVRFSSGQIVPDTTISIADVLGDGTSYSLTFRGSGSLGNSLPDGIYDLLVSASGVRDRGGAMMVDNYSRRFHRLFGDVDGNKVVNALDSARFRSSYGRSAGDPLFGSALDYEGNGVINALDLLQFNRRLGRVYAY